MIVQHFVLDAVSLHWFTKRLNDQETLSFWKRKGKWIWITFLKTGLSIALYYISFTGLQAQWNTSIYQRLAVSSETTGTWLDFPQDPSTNSVFTTSVYLRCKRNKTSWTYFGRKNKILLASTTCSTCFPVVVIVLVIIVSEMHCLYK